MSRSSQRRLLRWLRRKRAGVVEIVRTFRWTRSELAWTKARLVTDGVSTRARPPVSLGTRGYRGLNLAMRLLRPSCLERALVMQAWYSLRGPAPDVVIGVRERDGATEAHAWLADSDDPLFDDSYAEITRLTA